MYRLKDFKYLDIYNCNGKKLGSVNDVAINYSGKSIEGFVISAKFLSKKNYISKKNIVAIGSSIIAKDMSIYRGLKFSNIKGMEIIDKRGDMLGVVDDIFINEDDFSIKGLMASTGVFHKFIHGKRIFLLEETILGDNNILYYGNEEISLRSMPHKFWKQVAE
ncbi:MAG: PRC-barrel domain-containing protein [Clostridium perfringens]|nr:PRC-barrel domain-containing protein [Clostridium perfringens]